MNWIYSIAFKISGIGQLSQAETQANKVSRAVDRVGGGSEVAGGKLDQMGRKGVSGFDQMRSAASRYLAVGALVAGTLTSINSAANFDAQNIAIDFATSGEGAKNVAFVSDLTDRLGLNLESGREGFKQLAGSMRGTKLEGEATRDIFMGVAAAGGAMRLSADQLKGAYLAIGQISSKGKVQAEELRGQLGERLPGAFKIAADSMGVTQAELNKMLEGGKVLAEDFLPKFGAQLNKVFGEDAMRVAQGPAAAMERFKNRVYDLKVAFGTQLLPAVMTLLDGYLIPAISYISQHIDLFMTLGGAVGVLWASVKIYNVVTAIAAAWTTRAATAQWLWNAAMTANPIGLVIAGLFAVGAAVVYAWNHFAGFRGFLTGMWAALKEIGSVLYDYMIAPFMTLGKVIVGVLTFDKDLIASGLKDAVSTSQRMMEGAGTRIANAFDGGYQKGIAGFEATKGAPKNTDAVSSAFAGNDNDGTGGGSPAGAGSNTSGLSGITGRGSSKNITINLGNLVNELTISSATVEAGSDELVEMITRKLVQVINTANQVQ